MLTRIALAFCLLAACSAPAPSPAPASPSPAAPSAATSVMAYGTDMAWAQLTVALNERALQTLSLVRDRAADARLVTLAGDLAAGHADENVKLNALLRRIGAPQENPHTFHDMPGMATAGTIASMAQAHGATFDRLFLDALRTHLTQCQSLARSMLSAGKLPDALALAATIESTRTHTLTLLPEPGQR